MCAYETLYLCKIHTQRVLGYCNEVLVSPRRGDSEDLRSQILCLVMALTLTVNLGKLFRALRPSVFFSVMD